MLESESMRRGIYLQMDVPYFTIHILKIKVAEGMLNLKRNFWPAAQILF